MPVRLSAHACRTQIPSTLRGDFRARRYRRTPLGARIDTLFIEAIEGIASAAFLGPKEKIAYVRYAIRKVDTLKVLLLILWETKSLDNKKYIALSLKLDEVGRMLGGWNGQLTKQNSPDRRTGET